MTSLASLDPSALSARFEEAFGRTPRVWRAPGRINIIGEHVDYCGGLVMPAAIDQACYVASAPNGRARLRVQSSFGTAEIPLTGFVKAGDWTDYVAGMAYALMDAGHAVGGADLLIESEVPSGVGVSSSAALENAVGLALTGGAVTGPALALIAQRAENAYVGMPCGIMDQFASANAKAGHAMLLDCATLQVEHLMIPDQARFLLIDCGVKHALVDGEYAARRADCEAAAASLGVSALAQIKDVAVLEGLSGNALKRARHVVSEGVRTAKAKAALQASDLEQLGILMSESHESLSADMDVSTPELDRLAGIAQATSGVFGARMMGGGFGGSVIALVDKQAVVSAQEAIGKAYEAYIGRPVLSFIARAGDGASEVLVEDMR